MRELDLCGMTWYGALVAVILLMLSCVAGRKRRFDPEGYTNAEIVALANEAVHSARDRAVVIRRICDGIGYELLAEEFQLSVPQIKRIVYKAEDNMARITG